MWPTQGYSSSTPAGWSALDRRSRIVVLLLLSALALGVIAATWLTMREGQPSTPVYGGGRLGSAALWTWDGAVYRPVPTDGAGPYSNHADMAFDRARGEVLLWDHGCGRLVMGFTGGCIDQVNQTWTWDGQRWAARFPRSAPIEVGPGAMVYDSRLGQVEYVNGVGQAWYWNGRDWLTLALNGAPRVPRPDSGSEPSDFAVGYDEGRGMLVFALASSTWAWDGSSWAQVSGGIGSGQARSAALLVYDRAHRQLLYVGGQSTQTWDGARWEQHDQPALSTGAVAYDPVRDTVMLVRQETAACGRNACATSTWTWDSTSWRRLAIDSGPVLPLTRSGAFPLPIAFDEARGVMVLFASAS